MDFYLKTFGELTTSELYEILKSRQDIFGFEKGMRCRDIDGIDPEAMHCILCEKGSLIAYLRVLKKDEELRLGRVITLTHGLGHGKILMNKTLGALKSAYPGAKITVHAQYDAVGFYKRCGFCVTSDEFIEEGVRHFAMELM